MNLADMRSKVYTGLADRARLIDASEVDVALNLVWQYQIPNRVTGSFRDGTFSLSTVAGTDKYTLPTVDGRVVRSIRKGAFLSNEKQSLEFYEKPEVFFQEYDYINVGQSRPKAYTFEQKQIVLRPFPDKVYTIIVPCTLYNKALDANGIANDEEATTTCYGAIVHLAAMRGYDEIFTRFNALWETGRRAMTGRSLTAPRSAPVRADF